MAVANAEPDLPAGFRFDPSDRELVECYLTKKICNQPFRNVMSEFDVFQTEPWRLPGENRYSLEHRKYYFFDLRNRRFENMDVRPVGNGEWRMVERNEEFAHSNNQLMVRKNTLVYWIGQGNQALMTRWWMHEFVISRIFDPTRGSPVAAYRIFKI